MESTARAVIALNFESALAHFGLWRALEALAKWADLEASARAFLAVRPDHADAHARLGRALHEQGQYEAAEAAYVAAVRLGPDLPRFREGLALARQARKVSAQPDRRASRRGRR